MRKFFVILLLSLVFRFANAQSISRYNTFNYNVNEGLLQSTVGDIAVDKNNFCWISFPNGIQQFDGNNFRIVNIQPGLPANQYAKIFRCSNGDLLISHSQGISRYEIGINGFTHVYKQAPQLKKPAHFIGEDDGMIYIYDETATITGMHSKSFSIVSTVRTGMPAYSNNSEYSPSVSDNIIDHRFAFWMLDTICLWDLREKKLLYKAPPIPGHSPYFLHLLPGKKVLYTIYTDNDAVQCRDFVSGTTRQLPVVGKNKDDRLTRLIVTRWQDKYLACIDNHLYETDSTYLVLKSELVNFQNQPVNGELSVGALVEDNVGNLYTQTITGGIRKIIRNNYPIKYYGSLNKSENRITGVLPDKKNNRVLVGSSGTGLFIFDTLQHLVKHIPKLPGDKANFGVNAIIKDDKGNYILFVAGEKRIWKLNAGLSALSHFPISFTNKTLGETVNYFGSAIYRNNEEAVIESMYQLYHINFASNITTAYHTGREYTLGRLWHKDQVIYHNNDHLIFLDGRTFIPKKQIPFRNTGGVRCLSNDANGHILLGTNNGVFRIDSSGKILHHWNKENGLPDDCIYSIAVDQNGYLWCSSNKGIFRIDNNNNILRLTREDGLQENEFNTGVVATAEDGELFFGGMNGVSSFFPSAISSFDERVKMLVTRIRVNNSDLTSDSAVWGVDKLKLRYDQNSLSFDFVAMANSNPAQYIYQYRMSGIDKEWLQNSGLQTVRYSLPPGKYTFQVYASRSFDKDAKPMKEIRVIISPPFWKSWWFRIGLSIAIVGLLTYTINQAIKRKYAKRLIQLEHEKKIKEERERISKDLHDSLGAYVNAVLYNADLLEKERTEQKRTELVSGLKFASKDIITSLRETVWALKKESYTAEDCLVRIRNFIQPFTRYYEHISFRVNGEAPAGRVLHYTSALSLVRIVQEAISNSIKHAQPTLIQVTSSSLNDQWKLVITDDGHGFDYPASREAEQGNGLSNMEQRALAAGFEYKLETLTGKGTIITIIV